MKSDQFIQFYTIANFNLHEINNKEKEKKDTGVETDIRLDIK